MDTQYVIIEHLIPKLCIFICHCISHNSSGKSLSTWFWRLSYWCPSHSFTSWTINFLRLRENHHRLSVVQARRLLSHILLCVCVFFTGSPNVCRYRTSSFWNILSLMSHCTLKLKPWTNKLLEILSTIEIKYCCESFFPTRFAFHLSVQWIPNQRFHDLKPVVFVLVSSWRFVLDHYPAAGWAPDQLDVDQRILHGSAGCCCRPFSRQLCIQQPKKQTTKTKPDRHVSSCMLSYRL